MVSLYYIMCIYACIGISAGYLLRQAALQDFLSVRHGILCLLNLLLQVVFACLQGANLTVDRLELHLHGHYLVFLHLHLLLGPADARQVGADNQLLLNGHVRSEDQQGAREKNQSRNSPHHQNTQP